MRKSLKKKISVALSIAMVATSVDYYPNVVRADVNQTVGTQMSINNYVLGSGTYYMSSNLNYSAVSGTNHKNGLVIAENSNVVIYLNGYTLSATGLSATNGTVGYDGGTPELDDDGDLESGGAGGTGGAGGYAGIKLPSSSTLTFVGVGTVNATGGGAGRGGAGGNGGAGKLYDGSDNYCSPGSGGGGGGAGGGAGAGIGTDGTAGTNGTAGGNSYCYEIDDTEVDWSNSNYASASVASANSAEAGTLYVYNDYSGSITINATGGSAYTGQSSAGSYGASMSDSGTGWSKDYTSTGGAGGASGGGGGAAYNIGSGGTGGTGGVGGASGNYDSNNSGHTYRFGHGGGAGKGGNNGGASGINGGEPTATSNGQIYFNGGRVDAANAGSRGPEGTCTNLYLRGVYAFDSSEKTYKVGDFISKNEITAYEVYSTNSSAAFDPTQPLNTYYNSATMSGYNSKYNSAGWFAKSITADDYTIVDAKTEGENAGKLEVTQDLIKSITKTANENPLPTGAVKIKLKNVDATKAVSEGVVSSVDIDMREQQTEVKTDESAQVDLGDYPTEGEAATYNDKISLNTITYDGKEHSLAELIKNTGYGYSNDENSTNAITDNFFKKGLESSTEETDDTYWYSDYAMAPYYRVKYEPYKTFETFTAENYLTGSAEGVRIDGQSTNSPYFAKGVISSKLFKNAGYYSVTVVVPYKYYTYRYNSSWSNVHYFYRTYNLNVLIRQADLGIAKASDTVYENTKVQNHTFTRNVEGQNEEVFGEFVYSSNIQSWDNNEGRSANNATPLIEDITWEFNVYSSKDQNNYLCQFDGPNTGEALNSYYSNNNGTLLYTDESVAKRTIDMDVNVYYEDEQSEEGTLTPVADLKKEVVSSDDEEEKTVKSVYAETIGVEAKLNRNDTSLGFRVLEGDAVTGNTVLGTKIDETTLPSQYQGYFDDLVGNGRYKGDYYVITIKAGENVIFTVDFTDNSEKSYSELIKKVTNILPTCEFYGVEAYDVTIDYIGLYYTTETSAAGRLPDWNGEEEFNWVSSQVNFKVDVDQRDISIKELSDIDKVYDGTDYIVSQTLSEQGDVTNAAGYVVDVATINATDTQFKKKGTTTFFNYYDVSYDSSNAMKLEMSGTYDDKNKGQNKVATVNSAKIFAAGENNSYLNYNLINIPTEVSGDVSVANMYFNHNLYGTMEVQDSTPLHEIYGITSKAYLLHTELDENGYIVPAATTLDELVEKNDVKTASAAFTTNEEEYDYDTTYKLVDNRYSPDVLGIDSNTGEITEVAIATKGGTNPSQFPSAIITIADYSNFTLIKPDEHVEVGTYGECEISENKNNLTYSDEATSHEMRYRIIGNENTYDIFLPVNQINNGGFDSKYIDKYVSFVKNGEERFDYLTVYEEGDDATFKFTVPQNSYLEDLYVVDLGEYKSYLQDDIKTFEEMQALIETEDALGSFNTQTDTLNANDNPLYLKLESINDVDAVSIPEANAQVGGSTFKFTITTGNSILGNNKSIAIVPVFKEYKLLSGEYEANLGVESTIDTTEGTVTDGDDDFVYVNYKTDFDTNVYNEAGYGLVSLSYKDAEEQSHEAVSNLEAQTLGYYSIGLFAESEDYINFFAADKLIPGTEVDVTIKVWRDGITENLNDLTTDDPDAFDEVTFKWTVTEEDYYKLFDDDSVIFRKDNSIESIDNITSYAYYNNAEAFTFGKVAVMVEKQEDGTWELKTDVNLLDVADTWYVADGNEGTRVVISDDAENDYPIKSVGGTVQNNVPYGTSFYPTYEVVKLSEVDMTSISEEDWTTTELGYARLVFGKVNPCEKMIFAEKEEDIAKVQPYAEATYEYETDYAEIQPYTFVGWVAVDQNAGTTVDVTGDTELANGVDLVAGKKINYAEFYALEDLVAYGVYDGDAETINLTEMLITEEKPESGKVCECTTTDMSQFHVDLFKDADWYYDAEMTEAVEDLSAAQVVIPSGESVAKFYLATQKVEEIQAEDIEVFIGDTTKVEYKVLPEDAYDKSVTFESTDADVATVDEEGNVVAVGVGTTTIKITASDLGEVVKEINVVVNPILVSKITLEDQSVYLGETVELEAIIEPDDATDKSVTWTSSDETIATVDENGVVTTVGCGTVTITATAVDDGKVEGIATIEVKPILIDRITLENQTLFLGESVELVATIEPENATDKSVIWASSDEKIAKVDENGKVTTVGCGTVTITATAVDDGKVVGKATVVVKPILVSKVTLKDQSLLVGESVEMVATIEPDKATDKTVTWTSSDEKVATVDSNGKVTAVAFGKAVITAKALDDGKVIGTANISVWDKVPTKEDIHANTIELNKEYAVCPTKKGLAVKWNKVEDAEGYEIFVSSCNKKFVKGEIINVGKDITKIKVNKIKGKKMNLKKNYKVLVKAYKTVNGKKTYIAKSVVGHIVGKKNKKYSNPVKIKLKKSSFILKVGEKVKVKGKVILKNKKKKQLSNKHARRLRFKVADSKVATVSKYGNITAVSAGTTTVYVYARNGYAKEVKVTVK